MKDYKSYFKKHLFHPKHSDATSLNEEEGESNGTNFGDGAFNDFKTILFYVSDENGWILETEILYRVTKNSYVQFIRFFNEVGKLNSNIHPERFRIESQYKIDQDLTICENIIEALRKRINTRRDKEGLILNFGSQVLDYDVIEKIIHEKRIETPYWYVNFKENWDFRLSKFKFLDREDYAEINFEMDKQICDEEHFYQKAENTLPLFIKHEHGIYPEMNEEQILQLKNQQIALLRIASRDEETRLDIYESTKKGLVLKAQFDNRKTKSLNKRIEIFNKMKDFDKVNLFYKMLNGAPTLYDDLLKPWWQHRY